MDMHYMITLGAAGADRDPPTMAELVTLAEASGWDAILLEDYIVYPGAQVPPTFDPWIVLAAMAVTTTRIRLGTMVTPLTRRRPWKLASEAVSLDHLSGGRVILGVGAGDSREPNFMAAGEPTERQVLAERLDEGLRLSLTPLQKPRIPIWIGGDGQVSGVRRRLVRWDGWCVYKGTPGTDAYCPMTPDDVCYLVATVVRERGTSEGFKVCVGGRERGPDWDKEREYIRSLAAAGATWWQEWVPLADRDVTQVAVSRGPLRID